MLLVGFLVNGFCVRAGEFNEVLNIGDAAPAWTELPGTDGKKHSLSDYKDRDVVVLIFTCASCPTAVDYEDRIIDLARRYGGEKGKVAVVAVCVNRVKGDTLPDLTERAKQREFPFDYLYDESQQIARNYGAIFTPECYVLNRDRKLVYMGALDDRSDAAKVQKKFVEEAIAASLNGQAPAVQETIARGCRVRYARERK
ncbi:MAG: thioredoxin family protein [Planctomycetes bacterium]|nr:thioredoxin family protein [Planctomycetota bacterium]